VGARDGTAAPPSGRWLALGLLGRKWDPHPGYRDGADVAEGALCGGLATLI